MSGPLDLTAAARVAMLEGLLARGPASTVRLLNASDVTLAVIVLAVPCGAMVGNALVLSPEEVDGNLISTTGTAVAARWYALDNTLLASGTVTDEAGEGPFKLQGTTGTLLLAGGRAKLGVTAFT